MNAIELLKNDHEKVRGLLGELAETTNRASKGRTELLQKIALELKKPNAPSYDTIVATTIRAMRLDPVAFRRYLGENGARNMSLLLATARTGGL